MIPPAMFVTSPPVSLLTANAPTARPWISGGRDLNRDTAALTSPNVVLAAAATTGAAALAVSNAPLRKSAPAFRLSSLNREAIFSPSSFTPAITLGSARNLVSPSATLPMVGSNAVARAFWRSSIESLNLAILPVVVAPPARNDPPKRLFSSPRMMPCALNVSPALSAAAIWAFWVAVNVTP